MNENNDLNQIDSNFFNIIISLSQSAAVAMGKISNSQTGKIEKNMIVAKGNIDILQMLKDKTKGNLTKKENEILSDTLTNLQLTYADESKKDSEEKQKKEEKKEEDKEGKEKKKSEETSIKKEEETAEREKKETKAEDSVKDSKKNPNDKK